ncbi:MAG: hypothetical protein K8U57_20175 [Planctomycetes bacterium]|nr:hypothetical protein [Planctomycetota bacterium]
MSALLNKTSHKRLRDIGFALIALTKAELTLHSLRANGTLMHAQWKVGRERLRRSKVFLTQSEAEFLKGHDEAGEQLLMLALADSDLADSDQT